MKGKKSKSNFSGTFMFPAGNGSKCNLDGTIFDEGGTCSHGHQHGDYIVK